MPTSHVVTQRTISLSEGQSNNHGHKTVAQDVSAFSTILYEVGPLLLSCLSSKVLDY